MRIIVKANEYTDSTRIFEGPEKGNSDKEIGKDFRILGRHRASRTFDYIHLHGNRARAQSFVTVFFFYLVFHEKV